MSRKALLKKSLLGLTAASMLAGAGHQARAGGPEFMEVAESNGGNSASKIVPDVADNNGGILNGAKSAFQYVSEHKMMIGALLIGVIGTVYLVKFSADHNFDSEEMLKAAGEGINDFFGGVANLGQSALNEARGFGQSVKATMGGYDQEIDEHTQKIKAESAKFKESFSQNPFVALREYLTGKTGERLALAKSNMQGSVERMSELKAIKPLSFLPSFSKYFGQEGSQ